MRVIKFKGKTFEGFWVYGFYQEVEAEGKEYSYIFWQGHTTPVIKETVCQYTGLDDVNGTPIFEKDIVTVGLRNKVVEYYKDGFWLNKKTEGANWNLRQYNNLYVVGNIIDNPELLER